MFSPFTFINFLYVVFKSHSWVDIVNAFYDSALFIEAGRLAVLFMVEFVLTALFSADTQHREAKWLPVNWNRRAPPSSDHKHITSLHFLSSVSFLVKSLFIILSQTLTVFPSVDENADLSSQLRDLF